MIKHLITGGCSFSHSTEEDWIAFLTTYLQKSNIELTCNHTGYFSQGQELIQKKVMLATIEALDSGHITCISYNINGGIISDIKINKAWNI